MSETAIIKKPGNIRVRANQIEMIVEAMERNPFLNMNKLSASYSAAKRSEDWEELSKKLNNSGGAIKSVRCWQKCWSDKKGEVKKKNNNLKTAGTKEKDLTPLEERIVLLFGTDAPEGLVVEESESIPEGYVIPKVEDCPDSPTSGNSHVMATLLSNSQPFTQESKNTVLEEYHLSDKSTRLPATEESQQPEFLPQIVSLRSNPQPRIRPLMRRVRTKHLVIKNDNAQKLVEGQTNMATALTRCADALEKHNEIQERALEIEKRKVDVLERTLEIEKRNADALEKALGIKNRKADAQERTLEIEKRKADCEEIALEFKKQKADAFVKILSALKSKF